MLSSLIRVRNKVLYVLTAISMMGLSACDDIRFEQNTQSKPSGFQPGAPVSVALLVPSGSDKKSDAFLAANLENAARLAIADLKGVKVDLRVYPTAGNAQKAANAAAQAVNDGAQVILGPLYADAANSAGVTVAKTNVNVLAFSNNPTIAGGNVFILGSTFSSAADRLVSYANRRGLTRFQIAHANDLQGQIGREVISSAIGNYGGNIVGIEAYPLTQAGVQSGVKRLAAAVKGNGAQAIFTTAGLSGELPLLATATHEKNVSIPFLGLTRWDAASQTHALPGLQNGLFTIPKQVQHNLFSSRYAAVYGQKPHALAGLAYDGISAIGALVASGHRDPLSRNALLAPQGFEGTSGIFRFLPNGVNQRGLSVATLKNGKVVILEPAPSRFDQTGS